jgi:ribosomal protein S27E
VSLVTTVRDATGDIGAAIGQFFSAPPPPKESMNAVRCPDCGVIQLTRGASRSCADPECGATISTAEHSTGIVVL